MKTSEGVRVSTYIQHFGSVCAAYLGRCTYFQVLPAAKQVWASPAVTDTVLKYFKKLEKKHNARASARKGLSYIHVCM
jgi:hypothetical protein